MTTPPDPSAVDWVPLWTLGAPSTYGTTLPVSPVDGQEHTLVDSLTNPTYSWRFRYNASSTSTFKWEFVGGPPIYAYQDTSGDAVGNAWVYLTTPRITPPRPGDFIIHASVRAVSSPTAGNSIHLAAGVSSDPSGVESSFAAAPVANYLFTLAPPPVRRTINAGQTAGMWSHGGAAGGTVYSRALTLTPLRVS